MATHKRNDNDNNNNNNIGKKSEQKIALFILCQLVRSTGKQSPTLMDGTDQSMSTLHIEHL